MQATLERLRERREELGDEGGFTLIELLIVIVILGILAAIVVFAVQNLAGSSALASCKADVKTAETAAEAYKAQMGNYPKGGATAATSTAGPVATAGETDSDLTTANAAAAGGELLTGSYATSNGTSGATGQLGLDQNKNQTANAASPTGNPVGPWLKDVPVNGGHYGIFVSNDGTGTVTVDSVTSGAASGTAIATANGSTVAGVCADVS